MLDLRIEHRLPGFRLAVELTVGRELLVLFGHSGAGKTMTLRAVAGLVRPEAGRIVLGERVLFDGERGVNLPPRARRVGYVPQSYALFPHLTVFQNVAYGVRERSQGAVRQRVGELLELMGLSHLADRRPRELSGGQQQRVALARALAVAPEALLLDEPLSALDAPTRGELRSVLRDLQRRFQVPTLFVTHDLSEAVFLADRIAVLQAGRLLQVGPPGELLRWPAHLQVAQLAGVRNILPGRVVARGPEGLVVRVGQVDLLTPRAPFEVGAAVYVCLRAERITLVRPERRGAGRENLAEGTIVGESSDGATAILLFRLRGPRLAPAAPHDLEIAVPLYVYERLGLATNREWTISIGREALHLLAAEGAAAPVADAGVAPHLAR